MAVPEPFNLTLIHTNSSSIVGLMQTVNSNLMEGWFGTMLVFAMFALAFLISFIKSNDAGAGFIAASMFAFIAALFFRLLELIPDLTLYGTIIVLAFAAATAYSR